MGGFTHIRYRTRPKYVSAMRWDGKNVRRINQFLEMFGKTLDLSSIKDGVYLVVDDDGLRVEGEYDFDKKYVLC